MATLLSQLGVGVNPFSTAVGQRIEQATDASLASENWALNMEICDIINETDEGPKDALRAIRKRLLQNAGKNYTVVMYTLTVLETCVKNCGKRFQLQATQKDFIQDLVKLIGPKNDPPTAVQEKVLSLIQNWAEVFKSNPEMQGVVQVFVDLKQKGIEFPSPDLDTAAPIHTPARTVPVQPPAQHQVQNTIPQESSSASSLEPHQVEKLKNELEIVQGNMRVFGEMLTELTPGKEHQSDLELLRDLCKTCQNMQGRLVELLDKVGNEKITEDLLLVNDELNNLFMRYDRFEKKRAAMSKANSQEAPSNISIENKPLIDLEESVSAVAATSDQLKDLKLSGNAPVEGGDGFDEFDMLAQSRKTETLPKLNTSLNQNTSSVTESFQEQEFTREQEFKEMERWLEEQPENAPSIEPGANSEEFDRFLATRAAAAERLPTINPSAAALNTETQDAKPALFKS
uniref:Putative cytosolic sorting protein gga2/tom1 n=1 Tax=Parasteatoda tepidariorum TaxID=114398 RepID=A0A2L2YGE7_PARTP